MSTSVDPYITAQWAVIIFDFGYYVSSNMAQKLRDALCEAYSTNEKKNSLIGETRVMCNIKLPVCTVQYVSLCMWYACLY